MKFKTTKKERHEIYKLALRKLKQQQITNNRYAGLCLSIAEALTDITKDRYDIDDISLKEFPEVYAKKPQVKFSVCRWFPRDDYQSRINILEKCINETKLK